MIISVNSKDNPQRPSRASLEAIKGDAHRGEEVAIQYHPVPSSAIQCNHAQSSAIKPTVARRLPSSAIQCHPVQSRTITHNQAQSSAPRRGG